MRLTVVSEDGAPLESALVKLTDGEGTEMDRVLTPADNGVAMFSDVAAGDIEVKVEAKAPKRPLTPVQLPQDRKTPGFEKKIMVSGDVDTLAVAGGEAKPAATGKQPGLRAAPVFCRP